MHRAMAGAWSTTCKSGIAASGAPFFRRSVMSGVSSCAAASPVGMLDFARVGNVSVGRFASMGSCVTRHPIAIPDSAQESLFLAVQLKGQTEILQSGRTMQLAPGNWGLCDAPKPCVSSHAEGVEQLHLLIPRAAIRLAVDPRFVVCRAFAGASRVSALMCQALASLFEELPALGLRRSEELAEVVLRLFHLAVTERVQRPDGLSARDDLRERITAYVESHLRDPHLSLDRIATDLKCTKRYLHMVFGSEDYTLNEYIWMRRLDRCRQDLENAALRDRSITETALSWGFSNLSHFSRAFREHFGVSPREVRTRC